MACCINKKMKLSICLATCLAIYPLQALADDASKNEAEPENSSYQLGNGLKLGNSGVTLGGYASIEYSDLENTKADLAVSHASLFVSWESPNLPLQFFSEIDSQYQFAADVPNNQSSRLGGEHALSLERLYFNYGFNDALTVRAGKFLTPFGRWNLIHADPLVWTTSRPLITQNLFPDNVTGLMTYGNVAWLGQAVDYSVFSSAGVDLHKTADQDEFRQALGWHLNFPTSENAQIGFSYINFSQQSNQSNHFQLFGADLLWKFREYEVMGEYAYRLSSQGSAFKASGGYLQGVVPLWNKLYGVLRLENMHDQSIGQNTSQYIIGLNYRQNRALSYKVEYLRNFISTDIRPQGVMASVSVLF